jgi:hypothetical protein
MEMKTTTVLRLVLANCGEMGSPAAEQAKVVAEPEMAAFCTE